MGEGPLLVIPTTSNVTSFHRLNMNQIAIQMYYQDSNMLLLR